MNSSLSDKLVGALTRSSEGQVLLGQVKQIHEEERKRLEARRAAIAAARATRVAAQEALEIHKVRHDYLLGLTSDIFGKSRPDVVQWALYRPMVDGKKQPSTLWKLSADEGVFDEAIEILEYAAEIGGKHYIEEAKLLVNPPIWEIDPEMDNFLAKRS